MAQALYGLSTTGKDQLNQAAKIVNSSTDTLTNESDSLSENIEEQVQGLLRGYVVYSVDDNQTGNNGTVSVTIVVTPKTMGKGQRIDLNALSADTIKDGLSAVLTELENGLTPPVGGRVISVPETGEIAFIGFGSAVIHTNPHPTVQVKLNVTAQKMAQIRARSALCGIIIGDEVSSTSSLDEQTERMSKQFQEIQKEDPIGQNVNTTEISKLNNQRNSFVSTTMTNEEISSLRRGVLPPGVSIKTFFNPEKTMAEAVAVYLPSASANAASFGEQMKNAKIMRDPSNTDSISDVGNSEKQGSMPSRGASGQVTKDEDL